MNGKLIILSAPSGAGKTTIVKELLKSLPQLEFSISATTRSKRPAEIDGKDYYFLATDNFKSKIETNAFIEYEEVYKGLFYGTLKTEVGRIWCNEHHVIFDVDVKGGINIKSQYGDKALLIFIMPPSIAELENRLRARATDDEATIRFRIARAEEELSYQPRFDVTVINNQLEKAIAETKNIVTNFIKNDRE